MISMSNEELLYVRRKRFRGWPARHLVSVCVRRRRGYTHPANLLPESPFYGEIVAQITVPPLDSPTHCGKKNDEALCAH